MKKNNKNMKIIVDEQTKNQSEDTNQSIHKLNISTSTNTSANIPFASFVEEQENEIKDDSYFEEEAKKTNLVFEEKKISVLKLYFHLSYTFEIILMILGTLSSVCGGFSTPYISYLVGKLANDFSDSNIDKNHREFLKILILNCTNEEEAMALAKGDYNRAWTYGKAYLLASAKFEDFDKKVDIIIKHLLIIGASMFLSFGGVKFFWSYAGLRQMHHLKEKYFGVILKQEQSWFDANNVYEFSTKVQAQFEQISFGVGEKFGLILQNVSQIIFGFVVSFYKSWLLTVIMLCISPTFLGCVFALVHFIRKPMICSRKTYERAGGAAEEMLYNIKTVASFSNFEFEINRFNKLIDIVHYFNKKKAFILGATVGGGLFFIYFSFFVIVMYSRRLIGEEIINDNTGVKFTLGDIETVIFSIIIAFSSIGFSAPLLKIIQESAIASSDYFTLYEREPQMDFSRSIEKPPKDKILGKIEFKNVDFYYPSDVSKRIILKNMNLVIEPGKKIALVGESGCGKSTIVNLIERLYDVTSGQILIDGIDIKRYDLAYIRNFIGYVQQEPVLLNKSIKENIIFGRYDLLNKLGDPDTLIQNAIEEAYASEFINETKEGINYVVGIKGGKLSGGQKQRVAIARAVLCEPKILILDEATSALDNKSEKEVQKALDRISEKNITIIIIAHRLSTIKNSDLIYAIKDGEIVEQGTHQELIDKGEYYYGLIKAQIGKDNKKKKNIDKLKEENIYILTHHQKKTNYRDVQKAQDDIVEKQGVIHGEIFKLLKNNKCDLALGIIGSLISGAITPLSGYILGKAGVVLASNHYHLIWHKSIFWCFVFLIVTFSNGFFIFLKLYKLDTLGSIITCNMRKNVVEKYLSLHIAYFDIDYNSPGALLTKLSIDTTQLNSIILTLVGDVLSTTGNIITGLTLGFYYDWRLTLITLVFLPFTIIAFIIHNDSARSINHKKYTRTDIEAGAILSECVINTKTIFPFNFQKPAVDMYLSLLLTENSENIKQSLWQAFFKGLGAFTTYLSNATVYYAAKKYILNFTLNFEDFMLSKCSLMMMILGVSLGLNGVSDYPKAKKAFISIFKTMKAKSLIPPFLRDNQSKIEPYNLKGKIEFRNVTFAYPTKPDIDVLKNVNFVIEPGQKVGLVGDSGSGKSTIIQLIERFYEVEDGNGEILIDDINIKNYNIYSLRKKIGLVNQEPVLFKRSVYENILYGDLDADKEKVLAAAKAAAIDKFFMEEQMGKKEDPVSGGEKQRLAIARAFLKNPVILLLDEATSSLDKENEKIVQESINILQKGRTSITIAHRLNTIQNSDIILVLEAGKLVEKGTHQELLNLGKKYANLQKYSE